jgi:hypothetical protein
MGCGCKQQPQEPVVPKGITPLVIYSVHEPTGYTMEELIRIKDYINSNNKTETERQFMADFMLKHYGDLIPGYCDQICLARAKKQVEELITKLK